MDNMNYWPYTNIHELNLDWIISKVKELDTRFTDDIETFVREYIDEHFAEWTVNANYNQDDETIIYTNGTGATLTAGDVIRFAIDNVYVNIKDQTARNSVTALNTRMNAAESAIANMPTTILNAIHPIGSEYITHDNIAPAIGGTWGLIEKELSSLHENLPTSAYTAQGSTTIDSITLRRSGSEVQLRFAFSNVSISETAANLVQLDLNEIGVSQLGSGVTYATAYSDTGNVLCHFMLGTDGMLSCQDCICFASGSYTHTYTGGLSAFSIPVVLTSDHLLNSACDRFIWRRTA